MGGREYVAFKRYGFREETYFSWKFIPVVGEDGFAVGTYLTVTEFTHEVITDRRMGTIRGVGQELAKANNLEEVWKGLLRGLEQNDKDVPLALLYSVSKTTSTVCVLEGTIGLPPDPELVPELLNLQTDPHVLAEVFRNCGAIEGPLLLHAEDGNLPSFLLRNVSWRGFGIPCTTFAAYPMRLRPTGTIMAFMLIGLNPRRPYNDDYQHFLNMMTSEITTSHVSTMLLTQETEKRQTAAQQADIERAELSDQLLALTAEYERSEAKFSRFADRINVGFAIVDLEGRVLYANEVWRRMFCVPRGNMEPMPWLKAILPQDREEILEVWHNLCVGKKAVRKPVRLYASDDIPLQEYRTQGRFTTNLFDGYPDLDQDGKVKSVMTCVLDISELKWTEEQVHLRTRELQQSELKYRQFAEHAPIGVSMVNREGIIEFVNAAWLSITGTPQEGPLTGSWLSYFYPDDVLKLVCHFVDLMNGKKASFTVESRVQRSFKAGGSRTNSPEQPAWILLSAYPELTEAGTVKNVVCWLTDISFQKAVERNIGRKMNEAVAMRRAQENFIDMISHEIRNPLSAQLHCAEEIISLANAYLSATESAWPLSELLSDFDRPPGLEKLLDTAREAAQIISYCVHHQKRIVDDVLTLSKLDSNLLTIAPTPVQPVKLAQDAFKMFEGELRTADIKLAFKEDPSIRGLKVDWVNLDPGRILQILVNLAGNALKFTRDEAERKITVSISASLEAPSRLDTDIRYFPQSKGRRESIPAPPCDSSSSERVYLSWAVEDTGRGISPEEQTVLFQRFSQASPKTHSKYGGSGLGLFISRQLTEMQGGRMGLTSEQGNGSKFVFYIKALRSYPRMKNHRSGTLPAVMIAEPTPKWKLATVTEPSQSPLKSHILVVEDNVVNQKVVSRQLRNHGCTVDVANDGEEALQALLNVALKSDAQHAQPFDVVLMDLEMPVMNGITAIRQIRKLEAAGRLGGHIPVIACTASIRDVEAAIEAGMVGFQLCKLSALNADFIQGQLCHKAFQSPRYPSADRESLRASSAYFGILKASQKISSLLTFTLGQQIFR